MEIIQGTCGECGWPVTDSGPRQHDPLCTDCRPENYDPNPLPAEITCWDCGEVLPIGSFINGQNGYTLERIREYIDEHPGQYGHFACNSCQVRDYILERA